MANACAHDEAVERGPAWRASQGPTCCGAPRQPSLLQFALRPPRRRKRPVLPRGYTRSPAVATEPLVAPPRPTVFLPDACVGDMPSYRKGLARNVMQAVAEPVGGELRRCHDSSVAANTTAHMHLPLFAVRP